MYGWGTDKKKWSGEDFINQNLIINYLRWKDWNYLNKFSNQILNDKYLTSKSKKEFL